MMMTNLGEGFISTLMDASALHYQDQGKEPMLRDGEKTQVKHQSFSCTCSAKGLAFA
jgi:hypothetical protein